MEHPDYYGLREHLITFLEERAQRRAQPLEHDNPDARGLMVLIQFKENRRLSVLQNRCHRSRWKIV